MSWTNATGFCVETAVGWVFGDRLQSAVSMIHLLQLIFSKCLSIFSVKGNREYIKNLEGADL